MSNGPRSRRWRRSAMNSSPLFNATFLIESEMYSTSSIVRKERNQQHVRKWRTWIEKVQYVQVVVVAADGASLATLDATDNVYDGVALHTDHGPFDGDDDSEEAGHIEELQSGIQIGLTIAAVDLNGMGQYPSEEGRESEGRDDSTDGEHVEEPSPTWWFGEDKLVDLRVCNELKELEKARTFLSLIVMKTNLQPERGGNRVHDSYQPAKSQRGNERCIALDPTGDSTEIHLWRFHRQIPKSFSPKF
ncbi:15571_t:CDS:2, partial [Acaulospora colombiana]